MTKIVKICGLKTVKAAEHAMESGADLLGVILVPNRARTANHDVVCQISALAKAKRLQNNATFPTISDIQRQLEKQNHTCPSTYLSSLAKLVIENGPFVVGVFRNQDMETVLLTAQLVGVDFVQLHGSEHKQLFTDAAHKRGLGAISRYVVPQDISSAEIDLNEFTSRQYVALPLLDSEAGGEGKLIDWEVVDSRMGFGKFILAGGLNPDNLASAANVSNVIGFDVSGGVEDAGGNKDMAKISSFIETGKKCS